MECNWWANDQYYNSGKIISLQLPLLSLTQQYVSCKKIFREEHSNTNKPINPKPLLWKLPGHNTHFFDKAGYKFLCLFLLAISA